VCNGTRKVKVQKYLIILDLKTRGFYARMKLKEYLLRSAGRWYMQRRKIKD